MTLERIAIIGCGTVAQRYYVSALKRHPELREAVYFVDTNIDNAESLREELGWGQISDNYREVLPHVNGAVILLPHFLHYPVSREFLQAGVHVLCEKPLSISAMEAGELVDTAESKNVSLCVNNTRRMFPTFRAVKEIIHSGELGRVSEITYQEGSAFGWPSTTGFYVNPKVSSKGILLDLGSHVIDTLCWWIGKMPELEDYSDDSYGGPESVARIRAQSNGCKVNVTLNRLCELGNTYRVVCEKGVIEGKIFDWNGFAVQNGTGKSVERKVKCLSRNYPGFVQPIFDNFVQVMKGTQKPFVSGRDVLPSLEFINECYNRRKQLDMPWDKGIRTTPARKKKGSAKEKKILVTGATGFIGGRIVEMVHLTENKKYAAIAGLRQWSGAARLGRFPADIVDLDLMDNAMIDRALEGITHVVHCAKGTPEVTVQGTRNILEASLKKGIRHFIHLSTADVYGDVTGTVDEAYPFQYTGNQYNQMKINAEKACWEYHEKGLPITVFRPSIVYGPFSSNWSLRFAVMLLAREWGIYEKYGEGKSNLVYVDDLVRTIIHSLDENDAFGRAFNINGPEIISWNEYFTRLNSALDLPPLKTIMSNRADTSTYIIEPVRLLGGLVKKFLMKPVKKAAETVKIIDVIMRRVEHAVKITPAPDELKLFKRDAVYSDALARNTLPYCPDTGIDSGLNNTYQWVKYLGLLGS